MKEKLAKFFKENRDEVIRKGTIVVMSIVGLALVGVLVNRESQTEIGQGTILSEEPEIEVVSE